MATEMSRNLLDTQRYNFAPIIAKAMGLNMNANSSLWRDEVQLVLNKAILASFFREGISVIDHHSASDSFMSFMEEELETTGYCPADWVWIVPPAGGSMTKVFHQEMINWYSKPCYRGQTMAYEEGNYGHAPVTTLKEVCKGCGLDDSFLPHESTKHKLGWSAIKASVDDMAALSMLETHATHTYINNWYTFNLLPKSLAQHLCLIAHHLPHTIYLFIYLLPVCTTYMT